ncbi:MAG: hypothetical protein K0U47_01705 [Epsilonproteobacteria bacterium]|nr:hypothetical protein [Campylobacterota bacterium]
MRVLLGLCLALQLLFSDTAVSGDTYEVTIDDPALEVIFTKAHQEEATFAKSYEKELIKHYTDSYGFALDDTLHVGLLSQHNQIPNAFSTQFPLNMQMNYIGGSYMVDYMSSTSWLQALLLHESAHNFQLNAKQNPLSRTAHKVIKNIPFTSLFFVPIFPVPNILESNFLIEGNAVFNESRFNNGGRLYNGAHLALTVTQAKAGLITPARSYNDHLYFPYNTHHYLVGGFFQLYLAQKYGVNKVNAYFYAFSAQYLPIQTNAIFKKSFGVDFEESLASFVQWLKERHVDFQVSNGKVIAYSKYHHQLNSDEKEIYFLTSDALHKPVLHQLSKQEGSVQQRSADYLFGKVFKVGEDYYTSASASTDVDKIMLGLFDDKGKILTSTSSKVVQDQLNDGTLVYFDVANSFQAPYLVLGKTPMGYVHSSVYSDEEDNLYYFKQVDKKRTLYKNDKVLFTMDGWYGFVVDVNENGVYFIANSLNGSTLYCYDQGIFYRVTQGDDIVDARLIDAKNVLLTTISADGYTYLKTSLVKQASKPYTRRFFFEDRDDFNFQAKDLNETLKSKKYAEHEHLHYSALAHSFVANEDDFDFYLGANFADPLSRNSARAYITHSDDDTLVGGGYDNSAHRVRYGGDIYAVVETKNSDDQVRDFGLNLYLNYPFYKAGYITIDSEAKYHLDHEKDEQEPLSLLLRYNNTTHYGQSMYPNALDQLTLFNVHDRGDDTLGLKLNYFRNFKWQLYSGLSLKYAKSSTDERGGKYGINIDDSLFSQDPSHFVMPSLSGDIYAKEALKTTFSLYHVIDFDIYNFSLPLSLRREALYMKYSYYDLTFLNDQSRTFSESILGLSLELLFFHKAPLPIAFEYLYNEDLSDQHRFRVLFDLPL